MIQIDNVIIKREKIGNIQLCFKKGDVIHVAYGCDERYVFPVGISMTSILKYNKNVVFHIFVDSVLEKDIKRIKQTIEMAQTACYIYYLDSAILKNLYQNPFWGWAANIRLIAAKELEGKLEKVLYLDADTLCMSNIIELFRTNIHHKIVGAVEDVFPNELDKRKRMEKLLLVNNYFYSGILLINLNKWQENRISEKAFELLLNHADKFKSAPDQDVLNYLLKDNVFWLNRNVNVFANNIVDCGNPIFIHFIGQKPWTDYYYSETLKIFDKEYNNIYLESKWNDEPYWKAENAFQYRQQSKRYFKEKRYFLAIKMQYKYLCAKFGRKLQGRI